jgi:transcriptional regulator GlxA family with amidase domain
LPEACQFCREFSAFMDSKELSPVSGNGENNPLAAIGAKVDFCMRHYQLYLRHDFSLHHLSVIANITISELELYFAPSNKLFDQYLDEWRVKYAKSLMSSGKVRGMEVKTIGSLSGFPSAKKFIEAFKNIEGESPEIFHSTSP